MNTNTEIKVVNDINAELQAGMFVTCRLGNPGDSDWSPMATVLLLHTDIVYFGAVQFTGLYKRADGSLHVARYLTKSYLRASAESGKDGESKEQGIMYCTCSVPIKKGTVYHSRYLSEQDNELLSTAMHYHHRDKIDQLPVTLRYKGDVCIDEVPT